MALVVSETALWLSWSNDIGTLSYIFSALIGYASLLSIIFFGDRVSWLGNLLKSIWAITLSNYLKAFTTSLLLLIRAKLYGHIPRRTLK